MSRLFPPFTNQVLSYLFVLEDAHIFCAGNTVASLRCIKTNCRLNLLGVEVERVYVCLSNVSVTLF